MSDSGRQIGDEREINCDPHTGKQSSMTTDEQIAIESTLESFDDGSLFGFDADGTPFVHGKERWKRLKATLDYLRRHFAEQQPAATQDGCMLFRPAQSPSDAPSGCSFDKGEA